MFNKTNLNFDTGKSAIDILDQFKKNIPSWSSFTPLLGVVTIIGAYELFDIIYFPMNIKLLIISQ